jgi:hypothetical protein
VIRHLNAYNFRPAKIRREIVAESFEGVVKEGNVRKWCRLFVEGSVNVHECERRGPQALVTEELKENVNSEIPDSRLFMVFCLTRKFFQK